MDSVSHTLRMAHHPPRLNLRKSRKDARDHVLYIAQPTKLPYSVNLFSQNCPPVYNQGSIGSCTANSSGSMYAWILKSMTNSQLTPSRLYIYYNSRMLEGTTRVDAGATLRDTMKSLSLYGVCNETIWAYAQNNLFVKPNTASYAEGSTRKALSYASVPISVSAMQNVLVSRPFVLGIAVYSSFMSLKVAQTGMVPVPNTQTERLLGGHAILVIGYNNSLNAFLCRNSWGTAWGMGGNFYLPYGYGANPNLAFDAWVLYSVENPMSTNVKVKIPVGRKDVKHVAI